MRKFVAVGGIILLLSVMAAAADQPKAEIFGGVSWLHIDNQGVPGVKTNYMGWDAGFGFNAKKWFGIAGDFSGNYGRLLPNTPTVHSYTAVFGPQIAFGGEHARPFAHALFGINSTDIVSGGNSAFAMEFGGGLDLPVTPKFAVRLGQLDWLYTRHDFTGLGLKDNQKNLKFAAGVVFRFGNH